MIRRLRRPPRHQSRCASDRTSHAHYLGLHWLDASYQELTRSLKRANARIEELQAQVGGEEQQRSGGFLDSMRDAALGRSEPRSSVPAVHSHAQSSPITAANRPRADACGFGDGLRRLPALDLPYNPLSTARRQPGIFMHVHPVLPRNPKLRQPQLPRSEPDGQPNESSQLAYRRARRPLPQVLQVAPRSR